MKTSKMLLAVVVLAFGASLPAFAQNTALVPSIPALSCSNATLRQDPKFAASVPLQTAQIVATGRATSLRLGGTIVDTVLGAKVTQRYKPGRFTERAKGERPIGMQVSGNSRRYNQVKLVIDYRQGTFGPKGERIYVAELEMDLLKQTLVCVEAPRK